MKSVYFGALFLAFVLLHAEAVPVQEDVLNAVSADDVVPVQEDDLDLNSLEGAAKAVLIFGDLGPLGHGTDSNREKRAVAVTAMAVFAGMTLLSNVIKGIPETSVNTEDVNVIPIHSRLAASVGSLTSESMQLMDDELKIMIAGTLRILGRKTRTLPTYPTWQQLISIFNQNVLIEQIPGSEKRVRKQLSIDETNWFKFNGNPENSKVRRVKNWFENELVNDGDVLADTNIDINTMGKIVGATGASINNFATFFFRNERRSKTVLEIGVLRFPDIDHPYFKVYRIKLVAYSNSKRYLFIQTDKNGIQGAFDVVKYRPRKSVMDGLSETIRGKAIEEAEDIFGW